MVSIDDSSTEVPLTLNAKAKVAEDDAHEQGANRLATGWDREAVTRMAEVLDGIASGWDEPKKRPVQVLRLLCELTVREPDRLRPGVDAEQWGFLGKDLLGGLTRFKVPGATGWEKDQEKVKSRLQEHWPALEEIWERQRETVEGGLASAGIELRPQIRCATSTGGNPNRYGFRFDVPQQPADRKSASANKLPKADLQYRLQSVSGNRLVRWMSERGVDLGGWAGKLYLGIFGPLFFGGLLLLWILVVVMAGAPTSLALLKGGLICMAILVAGYLVFGWQIRLVANRVTLAPLFLQPLTSKHGDYLLELRLNEDRGKNALYLVRYVADCPICGTDGHEKVRIESGRREFFGRLVGRCDRSPNEHVFSFDHVTRQGRFLR
jgi:hypothetical protein